MSAARARWARTLLVLVLAIGFRTWKLDSLPVGFSEDEAYGCRNAARFASGDAPLSPLVMYPEGLSQSVVGGFQPGLYYLWPVSLFRLLGYSRIVWRLSSVLPSVLVVLLLYPFGRKVLGERTAFWAALLLAVSRWHASEARWGWLVTAAWPFLVLGGLLVLSGLRRSRPGMALAGGAIGALPASFYPSALAFALVPFPAALLASPRRPRIALAAAVGIALGLVPTLWILERQPAESLARGRAASVVTEAHEDPVLLFVAGNVVHYAGLLFVHGDPLPWHTLPGTPALDPVAAAAFLAGLALALRRVRRPLHAFLLGTLGAGFAIGLVSQTTDAPNQYRVGLAAVAVAVVAARGLLTASRAIRKKGLVWAGAVPAAALVLSALLNARFLFVTWPGHPSSFYGSGGVAEVLARDIERLSGGPPVVVSPDVVTDRLRIDISLARTLPEAAAAGVAARVPYVIARDAPPDAPRILSDRSSEGTPRRDRWGTVLYRVVAPPAVSPSP